MIDFHVHLGNCFRHEYPWGRVSPSPEQLIDWMNRMGIEMACLLPLESPEVCAGYYLTEDAIAARDRYPERLIAFCCVDPRMPHLAEQVDVFVNTYGCKGFGEALNGLAFDDPLNKAVYAKCDELGLPYVFEINTRFCTDEVGLPRLEACLREFPSCIFCGHGPGFWCAISGDDDRTCGYPDGPITPGGAIDRLAAEYDNLYLDLSAGSGYNAMTRDPEFTIGFIERNWRKMLFATDYFIANQEIPHMEWLASLDLDDEVRRAIASANARRILRMDEE